MKLLIALLLITQTAWAGLPPTTVQGLINSTPKTKFNFQAPYQQMTDLGGVSALIETGNKNVLQNASFEDQGTTGFFHYWTHTLNSGADSNGIESTELHDGNHADKETLTVAGTALISQYVTPKSHFSGTNLEASCWVNTALTDVQLCSGVAGSTQSNCVTVPGDSQWHQAIVNFSAGNGQSVGVVVQNQNSETGSWYTDDCYVGPARNILPGAQQITNWQSCDTLTIGAVTTAPTKGTPVIDQCRYRRVGDTIQFHYTYEQNTSGSAGTGQYLFPIPAGLTADTTQVTADSVNGTIVGGGQASNAVNFTGNDSVDFKCYVYDSSHVACRGIGSAADSFQLFGSAGNVTLAQTNAHFNFNVYVPVTQYKSYSLLTTTDQSDFGSRTTDAWTYDNQGTVSSNVVQDWRIGNRLYVQGSYVAGTTVASTYAIDLPNGWAIDTANLGSVQQAVGLAFRTDGTAGFPTATNGPVPLFYDGSTSGKIFLAYNNTQGSFTKCNGNCFASGDLISFHFSVPISQWVNTNRAPNLIGSVTSSDLVKSYHMESAAVGGNGGSLTAPTVCSGTCSVYQGTNWVSSVTRNGTGDYTLTFPPGEFSQTPICTGSTGNVGSAWFFRVVDSSPTPANGPTSMNIRTASSTAAATDSEFYISCTGTR